MTVDVDQPFAYRSSGLLRSVGGLMKGLTGTGARPAERIRTMAGQTRLIRMTTLTTSNSRCSLTGVKLSSFSRQVTRANMIITRTHRDHDYREIIRKYDKMYGSGLHPSYRSAGRPKATQDGDGPLPDVLRGMTRSVHRQHWLLAQYARNLPVLRLMRASGLTIPWAMPMSPVSGQA
ncbi:MAG: hypothetical protein MZV63_02910 [Marinilabiliales bacterium]|nr:hypothetical protein [Marinilabiliales bacterium]